jgi:hypothetical protein
VKSDLMHCSVLASAQCIPSGFSTVNVIGWRRPLKTHETSSALSIERGLRHGASFNLMLAGNIGSR